MKIKAWILLYFIVLTGLFLRLYKYTDTLYLDTDQTAAYIIIDRILNHGHILLVGPFTSLWQLNLLPPTYYYITAAIYSISQNELTVPLFFTFINVISILLIFLLGQRAFNTKTGLFASLLFATSEQMVLYGRDFWEPHLVPFFIIVTFLFLIKGKQSQNKIYLHLSIISFFLSFLYVSSILLLPVYFLWITRLASLRKSISLFFIYGLIVYLPVLVFEYLHSFPSITNLYQIDSFASSSSGLINNLTTHIHLFFRSIFVYSNFSFSLVIFIVFTLFCFYEIFTNKFKNKNFNYFSAIFITGLGLTGIYSQSSEVYRLSSLYPIFFILFVHVFNRFAKITAFLIFFTFIVINVRSLLFNVEELNSKNYYHPYKTASAILDSATVNDFTIYTILPVDQDNHHSTSYWYALEKMTGKKLIGLNDRGNWIEQELDTTKKEVFLICRDFENHTEADTKCRDFFMRKYTLKDPISTRNIDSVFLYKFINNL